MPATSHLSDHEYFKYACTDTNAGRRFQEIEETISSLNEDIENSESESERLHEVVYNHQRFVDEVFRLVGLTGSKKELISAIKTAAYETSVK